MTMERNKEKGLRADNIIRFALVRDAQMELGLKRMHLVHCIRRGPWWIGRTVTREERLAGGHGSASV